MNYTSSINSIKSTLITYFYSTMHLITKSSKTEIKIKQDI